MKRLLPAALALAAFGFVAAHASSASQPGTLLGGWVQVVAYSGGGGVRICPDYAIAAAARSEPLPPSYCSTGLPAVGVQTDALTSSNPDESWGWLYLTGTYDSGTFTVSSQSATNLDGDPVIPSWNTPPCRPPHKGWRLVQLTQAQLHAVNRYERRHPRAITSWTNFDKGDVPTLASTIPRRTRKALAAALPRQLCVVLSHYTVDQVRQTRKHLVKLLDLDPATYGWVAGAGGGSSTEDAQPTAGISVLIVTPQLSAVLDRQPPGLVVVDATLHPVATS